MSELTVRFDAEDNETAKWHPIRIGVGERLFDLNGGNLTGMTDEDRDEIHEFGLIQSVSPADAIDEAQDVIAEAPGFDHVNYHEFMNQTDSISVEYTFSQEV